ncbi:ThiF family adenylyltransferase [Blastococcus sp. TF02A_35]|uniref:ThiF family adenylyltransferase n=1 Tax=Blastococcus sp. TF02A-35 TaxID=2559612 RepID=UPI00107310E7|nr:ThiF family adenylyltransferase [Blastococcus sp. TF02A_35]TFV52337.1 thiamine biosynthesis protein ThiF [Blastococcus sp. TF02A_35]
MSDSAHPLLPPATPLLHADGGAVQVGGVDSTDGLLLDPVPGLPNLIRALDGRRSQRAVRAQAARDGLDPGLVDTALEALRGTGLLTDLDPADLLATGAGPAAAARARVELPSAVRVPGSAVWRTRALSSVVVEGATRVGTPLAAVLAASGVGRVVVHDSGVVRAGDAVVGGLTAGDEGRPRSMAAADAVRRASPLTDLRPLPPGALPDLVVLTRPWAASDPVALRGTGSGAHLVATVRGETGVVGPLVVRGATSCLLCADLHRRDADARWPRLAAQLVAAEAPPSGSTLTCLLTALLAAGQALAYLDDAGAPLTLGATVELRPPDLLPRVRRWPAHPSCGCGAGAGDDGGDPAPPGGEAPEQGTMGS